MGILLPLLLLIKIDSIQNQSLNPCHAHGGRIPFAGVGEKGFDADLDRLGVEGLFLAARHADHGGMMTVGFVREGRLENDKLIVGGGK